VSTGLRLSDRLFLVGCSTGTFRASRRYTKGGQIVFLLAGRTPLADEPNFFARHVLHALVADPLRRPVGDAHADGGEASLQRSLCSLAPGERAPFRLGERVFSADGEDIGQMPFARAAACGDGEVLNHFEQVMRQRFLPFGRVVFRPMTEYSDDGGTEGSRL